MIQNEESVNTRQVPSDTSHNHNRLHRYRGGRLDLIPVGAGTAVALLGVAVIATLGGTYDGLAVAVGLGYAVVTVGMVLQIGYSGQLAFSQSVFMGVGAYGIALLETRYGFGPFEAILMVLLISGFAALVIGTVVTRAPGLALALATLVLSLLVYELATFSGYLGSFAGINNIRPLWSSASYGTSLVHSGVLVAVVLGVVSFGVARLLRSGVGFQLASLARDEALSESLGVGLRQRKLELFVLGSVLAALGGALVASLQGIVTPDIVSLQAELTLLVMLFVGGQRNIPGAIVGAVGIEWLSTRGVVVSSNLDIAYAVLLLGILLVEPNGLAGLLLRLRHWINEQVNGRSRIKDEEGKAVSDRSVVGGDDASRPIDDISSRGDQDVIPDIADGVPAFSCEGLSKHFGGVVAIEDVSLSFPQKGIFGLCGANGAGKSTLFNLLAGSLRVDRGEVWVNGTQVTTRSAAERSRLGVARTWQAVRLMEDRTALDNVAVACVRSKRKSILLFLFQTDYETSRERARTVLKNLGLMSFEKDLAGILTLQGQRMIEVARAVGSNPAVILADEPASGLSGEQRRVLADLLTEVATDRLVLMVEHDLDMIEKVSQRIYAMESGKVVFDGTGQEFAASDVAKSLRGLRAANEPTFK